MGMESDFYEFNYCNLTIDYLKHFLGEERYYDYCT